MTEENIPRFIRVKVGDIEVEVSDDNKTTTLEDVKKVVEDLLTKSIKSYEGDNKHYS